MFAGLRSIQSPWVHDTTFGGSLGNNTHKRVAQQRRDARAEAFVFHRCAVRLGLNGSSQNQSHAHESQPSLSRQSVVYPSLTSESANGRAIGLIVQRLLQGWPSQPVLERAGFKVGQDTRSNSVIEDHGCLDGNACVAEFREVFSPRAAQFHL